MRIRVSAAVAFVGVTLSCAIGSSGAPPQPYTLASSEATLRFCLGPCLCPYHEFTGPFTGRLLLTFQGTDPQGFDHYAVTALEGNVQLAFQSLPVSGAGTYRIGGAPGLVHQLTLELVVGQDPRVVHDSGVVPADPQHPFPQIAALLETEVFGCRQNVLNVLAMPDGCYADCDESGSLTVADFGCFQTRFVAHVPYADCTADGALTVADFGCFQTAFVTGCP